MRLRTLSHLLFVITVISGNAHAAEPLDRAAMQAKMKEIMNQEDARAEATLAGRDRGSFCTFCHGQTGISKKDWIPNLAGQSADYILDQNIAYATGGRQHNLMNELAASMTPRELINTSIFYAVQEPERIAINIDEDALLAGRNFYTHRCASCHGKDGKGAKGYTWIASQKPEYVRRALIRYRDSKEGRMDPEMVQVMGGISDQLIDDVASFLTTLR